MLIITKSDRLDRISTELHEPLVKTFGNEVEFLIAGIAETDDTEVQFRERISWETFTQQKLPEVRHVVGFIWE